ncbi:hypothetical protein ACJ72_00987 [Emergomyces africanus]|uniref:Mannosyltransferase n=1 Tax=Emergomyces africanus TaxID=1955775 RepID=A0A1B7P6L3_9EURO|nr:hypothetical protein ACJ72_00987 [Emergomyces africanus]
MARLTDWFLLSLIPGLILVHLYISPYTKVEESFNIQAIHDILTYGIPLSSGDAANKLRSQYDHFSFPGAVPRTFVGALIVAGIAQPFIWINSQIDKQLLARGIMGCFNALALISYTRGVRRAFGKDVAIWYILFQASQFHIIYYASRTLPNMFAFGIATIALRYLLPEPSSSTAQHTKSRKRYRLSLYLLTITGIVFRSEVALLLGAATIYLWIKNRITFRGEILPAAICGLTIGLLTTITTDSYLWQNFPLWPELSAFQYNVVSGHASAWEWRFILYTIPPLTTAASLGASYIWTHRTKSLLYQLLSLLLCLSTLATFVISTFVLLPISAANYPGAHALNALHAHHPYNNTRFAHSQTISVHMDNLACQTGVTRFLQKPPPASPLLVLPGSPNGKIPELRSGAQRWVYDKTDPAVVGAIEKADAERFWASFDYLLVEVEDGVHSDRPGRWEVVDEISSFRGVRVLRPGEEFGSGGSGGMVEVEEDILGRLFGDKAVDGWRWIKRIGRKYLTRGWWVEVRIVPRIRVLRRVR